MKRAYIRVGDRWVHYRRKGAGPVLVLLHGSPNTSRALTPLIDALAADFDCIAFDTPGNGESDPLPDPASSTADYADALCDTLDAMGLGRVGLYGFHTGAAIAGEFLSRHRGRATGAVLDGFPAWTATERADLLANYLPPFMPQWDGAHMTWLWSRFMEQTIFFPWFARAKATRMDYAMHSPEALHETVMEFLRAGDHYRKPYAAALGADGAAAARRIDTPCLICAHPLDPIAQHFDRFTDLKSSVQILRNDANDPVTINERYAAFLKTFPGDPAPAEKAAGGAERKLFAGVAGGAFHLHMHAGGTGRPLVLLHGAGASSRIFRDVVSAWQADRSVIAVDLAGHGETALAGPAPRCVEDYAAPLGDLLASLAIRDAAAIGMHLGGQVAVELKRAKHVARAAIIGAPAYTPEECADAAAGFAPDLSVSWDGAHLVAAWRFARLKQLYDPWHRRTRDNIWWSDRVLDDMAIHDDAVDILKTRNHHREAYGAQFEYPTAKRMREAGSHTIMRQAQDPLSRESRCALLARQFDSPLHCVELPATTTQWGDSFSEFAN